MNFTNFTKQTLLIATEDDNVHLPDVFLCTN